MTTYLNINKQHPQQRLVRQAAEILRQGGLIAYPTDSYYALGCLQDSKDAVERIRLLRGVDEQHYFTLSCKSIGQISDYGTVDNAAFRLMKSHVPGPYTFILKAGKAVAKKLHHPSRRTVALRVQSHPVAVALLEEIDHPIITSTLQLANDDEPLAHDYMRERLSGQVDCIIDAGACDMNPTTVLDFTETPPRLIREGGGAVEEI